MKRALFLAMLLLIAATSTLHWRLNAEMGELRSSTAQSRLRLQELQGNVSRLQLELAQASQSAPPVAASTNVVVDAKSQKAQRFLEHEVEKVRGLNFLRPIAYRTMASSQLKEFLASKLRQESSAAELKDYARGLEMVGLIPEGIDFEKTMVEVMGEQVAAFYDQDTAQLYTFTDSSLTGNLSRMILAHEMTHALQDQHFKLKNWDLKRKDNDDLISAHMALLEGDATVVMTKVLMSGLDLSTALTDLSAAMMQNTEKFQRAPRYFREMLLFPYQQGQELVSWLMERGGPDLVNRAFQKPPSSTSQVLHPEKFYPRREDPVVVQPVVATMPGTRQISRNVVGEFGAGVLLREWGHGVDATRIAAGWKGDCYAAFDDGRGGGIVFWRSQWVNAEAARKFVAAYNDVILKRNAQRQQSLVLETKQIDCVVDLVLRVPPSAKLQTPAAGAAPAEFKSR